MEETEPIADIAPIPAAAQPTQNDGGPDFDGHEGEDDNRTTDNPLRGVRGDAGESDSADAVGMASNARDSATATQNGGGGL